MRKGLHPLAALLGLATSEISKDAGFILRPEGEAAEVVGQMLLGIQRYQSHSFKIERQALHTIWQKGEVTIQAIPGYAAKPGQPVMLLVPSLVNKAYILDLMPERSLMRWLAAQNVTPYLLDWGRVTEDGGQQNLKGIILQRLVPAIEFMSQQSGQKINVLGYCMGGTLLAAAAQHAAHFIASCIYLAAPWDFHAGSQTMLARVKFWAPSAFPAINEKGMLSRDWMQILFASMHPKSAAKKFAAFLNLDENSDEFKLFVAVEDWLNDGVDLPAEVAQCCIKDWFFLNAPAHGEWRIGGQIVDPGMYKVPSLIITSERDRLVDYETAAALAKALKEGKIINTGTGHIGMIAGGEAVQKVWQPVADWVKNHAG